MKQKLTNIIKNEGKYLSSCRQDEIQVVLLHAKKDGTIAPECCAASLLHMDSVLFYGAETGPNLDWFVRNKDEKIFEAKAFGDHRDVLVVMAWEDGR